MPRSFLGGVILALAVGCSSSSTNTASTCTAGETKQCACPGAQVGVQTCQSSGSYGSCEQCRDPGSGGSGGSGAAAGAGGGGGLGDGDPNDCPGQELLLSGDPPSVSVEGNLANNAELIQPDCEFSEGMRSAVYRVTPGSPGAMTIEFTGISSARRVIAVREANCELSTSDLSCGEGDTANVSVKAGTEYYIVLAGDQVPYTLTVTLP
ncbi:MAG: hypothetical protein R3B89_20960 [Polyangiaceae bacterium]